MLHTYGGVYADIDVECVVPILEWSGFSSAAGIVGVEGNLSSEALRRHVWFGRQLQFVQWTMAFAPRHPLLAAALYNVKRNIEGGVNDTILKTGPGPWSDAVAAHQNEVTVLSGDAFACSGYSNSGCKPYPKNSATHTHETFLVRHWFRGSWKSNIK